MKLSINAYKYVIGLDNTYRLRNDGSWVEQKDFLLFDSIEDMVFSTFNEAQTWLDHTGPVLINGEEANTIPKEESNLSNPDYSFEIVAHRFSKPKNPIPTRDQLKAVLINGDDEYTNSLVIDSEGVIRLVPLINRAPFEIKNFPVRYESFQAGNGYVGFGASNDADHIENTYMALLEAWFLHVNTGRSFYRDYTSGDHTEQELINKINAEVSKLK